MKGNISSKQVERGLWKKNAVIDNRYEVRGLARGGMGEVYFVFDREIGRMVAVKTPLPSVMENPDGLNRFYREAEAWVSLGVHPNICSAYYVAEVDELPRLFIEYVDAGALDKWLREGTLSTFTEKLDMAIQIASGMDWTHTFQWTDNSGVSQTGIVHRDLKPANILMSRYGMALITDFGLVGLGSWGKDEKLTISEENASMIDMLAEQAELHKDISNPWQTMTIGGVPFGTPQYMAPEQFNDAHTAGIPADIYAYGCILYELFCGRRPFMLTPEQRQGIIFYQIMLWKKLHTNEPPPRPYDLTPGIDEELSMLMLECLDKDKNARPADFAAIKGRLVSIYSRITGASYPRPEAAHSELKADSLNNQGVSYATINQLNRAEQQWNKAVKTEPQHVGAAFNLAILGIRKGALKEDAAINKMRDYLQSLQTIGQGSFLMGKIHLLLGDEYTATNIIDEFSKERKDLPEANKIRALLTAGSDTNKGDTGLLTEAADNFKWFLDNGREDPVTATGYCHCIRELGGDWSSDYAAWRARFNELPESLSDAVYKYLPGFSVQRKYFDEFREALSLALSKDGSYAYAGMSDGRVYVYDLNLDTPINVFLKEQQAAVTAIDISKRSIAVGLADGKVQIIDAQTGQIHHIFTGTGHEQKAISAVRFLPSTIYLISTSQDGSIRIWDIKNLKPIGTFKTDKTPITALALSPDLKHIYTSHKGAPPCKWETKTGKLVYKFSGHTSGAGTIAINADGRYAVTGYGRDTVILWDTETGKPVEQFRGHSSPVVFAGFSADGRFMVCVDETAVRVWELRTGLIHRIIKYRGPIKCGAVSQTQNKLIISQSNEVLFLNFDNTYALSYTLVQPAVIRESEISYEFSKRLSEAKDKLTHSDFIGAATVIDSVRSLSGFEKNPDAVELLAAVPLAYNRKYPKDGWQVNNYPSSNCITNTLFLTYNGSCLIAGGRDGMVRKIDVSTAAVISEIGADGSAIMSMASDYISKIICVGTENGNVLTLDTDNSTQTNKFSKHKGPVKAVAMTGSGQYIFSAAEERTIRLWDTQDGGSYLGRFEECAASISALALHKDERIFLSGMEDGSLIFWDSVTGKSAQSAVCHGDVINSIALSGNGLYAITASADGLVGLWNIKSMKLIKTFNTGDISVLSAAFCQSDDRYFACGTMEGTIHLFNIESDECLFKLTGHKDGVNALVFSQNGFYIYSASLDGTIVRWFIDWELTTEENITAKQTLKQIMTQYLSHVSGVSQTYGASSELQTMVNAAGLSHLIDNTFEATYKQIAATYSRKAITRPPLIQEEIAVKPTVEEVKVKAETTLLKKVIIATVAVVVVIVAVVVVNHLKSTRYNTSQLSNLVKEDAYFNLIYDAAKFIDRTPPSGCNPSEIEAYKESFSVFIKKNKAVVVALHPKSRENIGCLMALRADKAVVKNLINEMVQNADPGNSQALSALLSYMGSDIIPSLTDLLGSEGFVKGNETGARLAASTLAAMGSVDSANALVSLAAGYPYLGSIIAPDLGRIFFSKKLEPEKALQLIETLMANTDEKVRKYAVGALVFIKGSKAKGLLEKGMSDPSAEVSGEAKKISGSM
ncbi:MAG: serine/threonine protein kinase [Nitrospirae bacterium]|nr:serine/threonine protein kinase [Nitrospirota bacterium]